MNIQEYNNEINHHIKYYQDKVTTTINKDTFDNMFDKYFLEEDLDILKVTKDLIYSNYKDLDRRLMIWSLNSLLVLNASYNKRLDFLVDRFIVGIKNTPRAIIMRYFEVDINNDFNIVMRSVLKKKNEEKLTTGNLILKIDNIKNLNSKNLKSIYDDIEKKLNRSNINVNVLEMKLNRLILRRNRDYLEYMLNNITQFEGKTIRYF